MILIKNAKIYTMADDVIDRGDILIDNGKILEVRVNIDKKDAKIINGEGLVALPGLVDSHCHIGGIDAATNGDDLNEMVNNVTPYISAVYGIDATSKEFEYAYKNGITSVALAPGSGNVVGGLVFAAKTYGDNIFDMIIKNPIALKAALGGNPKRVYGKQGKLPMTRMGIAAVLRGLLTKGNEYMKKKEEAKGDESKMPEYDEGLEAVEMVLRKQMPLKVHCTQFDMETVIRIAKEFDINFTLDHAWGASGYIDEIVESGCGVVFGPMAVAKRPGPCRKVDVECVVELDKRGVLTSIMTDGPILKPQGLIYQAGEAVREGLDVERALRMITINGAKIMGVDDRIGSIEVGKDADIVLFNGIPAYDTNAEVMYTIIDGKIVYKKN